jgi:chromosomal replication initiator protein
MNIPFYILPGLNQIEDAVSKFYGIDKKNLLLKTRKREVVLCRQICMWWRKNNTKESLSVIGSRYGKFDHATVSHAAKTVNNLKNIYSNFRIEIEEIESMVPFIPELERCSKDE